LETLALHNLYHSYAIIGQLKSKASIPQGHAARAAEIKNVHKILIRKLQTIWRPTCR